MIKNDSDGDMLIWGTPETGGLAGQSLLHGTGKYKGIKGNTIAKITAYAKKTFEPGNYQMGSTIKGTYELAPDH